MRDPRRAIREPAALGQNTGHGHVYRRPDRVVARCGGPGLCATCMADHAQLVEVDTPAALAKALPFTNEQQADQYARIVLRRLADAGWQLVPDPDPEPGRGYPAVTAVELGSSERGVRRG